jgi:hypothetical protein
LLLLAEKVNPWTRITPAVCLVIVNAGLPPPTFMIVAPRPAPLSVMALEIDTDEAAHEQLPAGTFTVDPVEAEFIALWTALEEQLAALRIWA